MKQIKLEVGKTYLSREGEEVKIVEKIGGDPGQFKGNNGEWYPESGRWDDFGMKDPEDLVEEVTISDANQKHNKNENINFRESKTR